MKSFTCVYICIIFPTTGIGYYCYHHFIDQESTNNSLVGQIWPVRFSPKPLVVNKILLTSPLVYVLLVTVFAL